MLVIVTHTPCIYTVVGRSPMQSVYIESVLSHFKRSTFVRSAWSLVFFIPGQWPPTSKDFYPRFYPLPYCPILVLEKEPLFPFSMLSAKYGNYWYHFYNVFGMTWSLTGDWTRDPFQCWVLNKGTTGTIFITSLVWRGPWLNIRDLPHSKPALYN